MKAVILAAGQGSRLRPLTDEKPKCMVEFRGKQMIDHILEAMKSCGLEDISLVKGYCADKLNKENTHSFFNEKFDCTNMVHSLFLSKDSWNDDLIISYSDIVYDSSILEKLIQSKAEISVVIDKNWCSLWEKRMDNPLDDAESLILDPENQILELGKSTDSYENIHGQYMGLIKIKKSALAKVLNFYGSLAERYETHEFENMYMTRFIQHIIDELMPVQAVVVEGGWVEIDTLTDLERLQ